MKLAPKDLYEKLEFDKILHLLEKECMGEQAIAYFKQLQPQTDFQTIETKLKEVKELKLCLEKNDKFPSGAYTAIDEDLKMLAIEGYVLSIESLQKINAVLLIARDIFRFFSPIRQEIYPTLYQIIRHQSFDEGLIAAIIRVIDENGEIRADASPELVKIRRNILAKQKELENAFRGVINNYRNKGWLTDNVESFRNGRRVLSVPSEHKRKIRGIIHDESTTGRTAFIEPEEVIDINNDIFDLETEEKREIYRILKELSAVLRPYVPFIHVYQLLIVQFDIVLAKAKLAVKMKGNKPNIVEKPSVGIKTGYHPLLYLKNKIIGKKTVPFDLVFFEGNRILILSGPNAGGKSITMKAVGLLQLMLQSGLLVSVDPRSEFGIFDNFFADIGDQQSIEDDLSTYSSRLKNMKYFLENANEKTLVLIDEFGSGTDPVIGGAIAEGILQEINRQKVFGIITTHYPNLKIFAHKTQGIINACMNFDRHLLTPTYELRVGRPGSSYGFEIAEKSGLSRKVLEIARKRIGSNEKAVDELLVDLQAEKQALEQKLKEVNEQEQTLQRLIKQYDETVKDLEFKRKKFKLDSKELALQQFTNETKELNRIIKELKETQSIEKARELQETAKKSRENIAAQVNELREDIYYQPTKNGNEEPLREGDLVRMKTGSASGKIESINKNEAIVMVGEMRMKLKLRDLQRIGDQLEIQRQKNVNTDVIEASAKFEPKIDLRGMTPPDALKLLESFLDQALIVSSGILRIVHGKGTGVLRQMVKKKLREYKEIDTFYHPEPNEGGDGVTIVEIK